jgi:tetratricopeptide (TPR) repeat protein
MLCLGILLSATGCGAAVAPAAEALAEGVKQAQLTSFRAELEAAEQAARDSGGSREGWQKANRRLELAISDEKFSQLEPRERAGAWAARGWTSIYLGDDRAARLRFEEAVRVDPKYSWGWLTLARVHADLGEDENAARTLARALTQRPDLLGESESLVFQIVQQTPLGSPQTFRLLEQLESSEWHSIDNRAGTPWHRLALERLRRGNREGASRALALIRTPDTIVHVRIDKRFDGLYDRTSPSFDPVQASKARIAFLKTEAEANPSSLEHRAQLLLELLAAGRNEEVLELTGTIAKSVAESPEAPPFEDMDKMAWIQDQRSRALERLGRNDEALAELAQAATIKEDGGPNVNQALNLAGQHCESGDGKKTLAAVERAGKNLSPYGAMVYHSLRHCGAVLTGDARTQQVELEFLRAHREDGKSIYLRELLRANRMDDAAREMIARLESERLRGEMLYSLQDFPSSTPDSPQSAIGKRWDQVAARSDVKLVIDKVGRIEHFEGYGY